jgi:hypothetical protein
MVGAGGVSESYLYDETGQRIRKTSSASGVTFYPSAGYEQTGGAVTRHYSFGGRTVAVRSALGPTAFSVYTRKIPTALITEEAGHALLYRTRRRLHAGAAADVLAAARPPHQPGPLGRRHPCGPAQATPEELAQFEMIRSWLAVGLPALILMFLAFGFWFWNWLIWPVIFFFSGRLVVWSFGLLLVAGNALLFYIAVLGGDESLITVDQPFFLWCVLGGISMSWTKR